MSYCVFADNLNFPPLAALAASPHVANFVSKLGDVGIDLLLS